MLLATEGTPRSQPYGATKAGLINFTESLRSEHGQTLDITGLIQALSCRLTDKNTFKMPLIITPEQAASEIAKQLAQKRFEIRTPWLMTRLMKILVATQLLLLFSHKKNQ